LKNCVRKIRRDHDESQQQLADAVCASRQAIIQIEKERVNPNGSLMLAIAKHYNTPVNDIFFDDVVIHDEHGQSSSA